MTMIDPAMGWFEITKVLTFDLDEVMGGNDEYIDKSSSRVSHLFNNTCICRCAHPQKVVLDNGSEFKRDFTALIKYLNIKTVSTTLNNPQANAPVDQTNQVIYNMLVTKYLDNKVFDYIEPWGETLAYIAWNIKAYYHHTMGATPGQDILVRDIIFNLTSAID